MYLDEVRQVPCTETILETLHNIFENHLTFEVLDFLLFKEKGIVTETSDYEKEFILYSTWSTQSIPFQLLLN